MLTPDNQEVLKQAIQNALPEAPSITQDQMERFVLAYPEELTLIESMTESKLAEIMDNSNLVEVLVSRASKTKSSRPVEAVTNQIVCDGRLKASIIFDGKHVVEILENQLAHYKKDRELKLRKRGRLAEQMVKQSGQFTSYSCISYVELEAANDERELLDFAMSSFKL